MTDRFRAGRRLWNPEDEQLLRDCYPHLPTADIAPVLRRSLVATYQRAQILGLVKSAAYMASADACRLRRGDNPGVGTRFKKGQVPANKGLRRPGWGPGRMKASQFKKGVRQGVAVKLWKPIGTERLSKDGYLERKVNDDLPLQARWRSVHLVIWEEAHGPLPPKHAVRFKNGDKTDIRLDNLELVHRRVMMARNSVHNLPPELKKTIHMLGVLHRQIRKRETHGRHEKQD